jgi:hypothetical protein
MPSLTVWGLQLEDLKMTTNTNVTLPQAGLDHMSTSAQNQLPPNLSPPVHVVVDDPSVNNVYVGTAGVTDVFVFDVSHVGQNNVDFIDNFEAGRVNAPADFTYEVDNNVASIINPPPPGVFDDPLVTNSEAVAYSTTTFATETVFVYDAVSPTVSFDQANIVHLQDGSILMV